MGKTAVITGAGRGIGAAIAEKLASEEWDVAILARKPQADGDAQCAEITRKYGVAARYYVCDISKADDRKNTVDAIVRDFGGIDALVNNAGVAPKVRAGLLEMSEESFDCVMGINLKGTLFLSQLVGRHFAETKRGVIVNIGSCSATVVSTNRGEYCISKAEDRKNTVDAVIRDFGGIDALVNNAGVAPTVRAGLLEMSEESFDYVTGINLKGTLFMSQLVGRHFAEKKSGVIVNIGSCSATVVSTNRGEYCISKAGVAMVTQLFAVEMAKYGVNVYEIRPGVIATDMTACVKEKYDKLIAEGLTLQPRWGQTEDVAKVVAMMLRGDIGYSTGQVVNVGGGLEVVRL